MANENVDITFRLRDRASQGLRNIRQNMRNTSDTMKSAGRQAGIFAAALGGVIFAAARTGATQRAAIRGLRVAIQNLGEDSDDLIPKIEATTAALQRKTNFGDEEQIKALTRMLPVFGSVEAALAALPAVLDIATASETNLATAADNTARAIENGEGRILRTLRASTKERILAAAPAERLNILQTEFAGRAEAAATGTIQFKNALGDLLETLQIDVALDTLGAAILDLSNGFAGLDPDRMRKVGEAMLFLFAAVTIGSLSAFAAVLLAITATGAVILGVAIAVGLLGVAIIIFRDDIVDAFTTATTAIDTFVAGLPDLIRVPIQFFIAKGQQPKITEQMSFGEALQLDIDFVIKTVPDILQNVLDWVKSVPSIVMDFAADVGEWMERAWLWVREGVQGFFTFLDGITPEWMKRAWTWVNEGVQVVFEFVLDLARGVPDLLRDVWDWFKNGLNIDLNFDVSGLGRRVRSAIPGLAHGGIVTGPTLAMIGESGPEAVIPLNQANGLGGATVQVFMPANGVVILDNEASARQLVNALMPMIKQALRTQPGFAV